MIASAALTGAVACAGMLARPPSPGPVPKAAASTRPSRTSRLPSRLSARTRPSATSTSVLTDTAPGTLTADLARQLFVSAPVVVVADAGSRADVAAGVRQARKAHAPLLLAAASSVGAAPGGVVQGPAGVTRPDGPGATSAGAGPPGETPPAGRVAATVLSAAARSEIDGLHPRAVLAVGLAQGALSARLPGTRVVTRPGQLPATAAPAPLGHVAVLVRRQDTGPAETALAATASVAGARVIRVRRGDPRADPAAIAALAAARPRRVVAVGAAFGSASLLASRVAVAETGVQLPGGGQVMFPGHRLVAMYGHPGAPALGVLGHQGLSASVARVRRLAALYRPLSAVPVIPTFEIIATVARGSPGADGDYSSASSVASLRPWVRRAAASGMYVILDLQPGRASLLAQAKMYRPLLALPDVGLALDPEWKLQPGQLPLRQIGSVSIGEVNSVVDWLAAFTAKRRLPQKVLVLHEFRLSMIRGERDLNTSHDDLAIVIHMDGQGAPSEKQRTWDAVTGAAPPGVFFGWKNFYVKDHPMLTPQETMSKKPTPVMISYQ